jgi:hypothetical protein
MGRVCSTCGGREVYTEIGGETSGKEATSKIWSFQRRIILEWIFKELNRKGMGCIDLVQHREGGWLS